MFPGKGGVFRFSVRWGTLPWVIDVLAGVNKGASLGLHTFLEMCTTPGHTLHPR